jgi:hypothetical protein
MLAVGGALAYDWPFRDGKVVHFEACLAWAKRFVVVNWPELRIPR